MHLWQRNCGFCSRAPRTTFGRKPDLVFQGLGRAERPQTNLPPFKCAPQAVLCAKCLERNAQEIASALCSENIFWITWLASNSLHLCWFSQSVLNRAQLGARLYRRWKTRFNACKSCTLAAAVSPSLNIDPIGKNRVVGSICSDKRG